MATHGGDYVHGDMEVEEHEKTYEGFLKMTKWGSLYLAAIVLFLTLWFCTSAGFLGGAVAAAVVLILGTLVLSEKHKV
jgi:hypothetical protein